MYKIDINKALTLPPAEGSWKTDLGYCAWGSCAESTGLLNGGALKLEMLAFFVSNRCEECKEKNAGSNNCGNTSCPAYLADINDRGEHDRARRLVIQLLLEKGFCEPVEADLELAKELLSLNKEAAAV